MTRTRKPVRRTCRRPVTRVVRTLSFSPLHGGSRRRGPSDLSQALTGFRRAIRSHRRLAQLAPSFFDPTIVDREARERDEERRWMESWEPAFQSVYGPSTTRDWSPDLPSPPDPRTRPAIERHLANWGLWMGLGRLALARHQQRRPHSLPSLTQLACLIEIATDLARLSCGLEHPVPAPATPAPPPWDPSPEAALNRICGAEAR